ncbi:hypothetical protein Taro_018024 [Colocasia esculenta]|uniref:Uncharacterized protein n=1 Tax=Colocasia esculenta TaxID=4460 RepID=A0A843UQC1_COLES|nr:hypothetical protein [Colocasia esculenta]
MKLEAAGSRFGIAHDGGGWRVEAVRSSWAARDGGGPRRDGRCVAATGCKGLGMARGGMYDWSAAQWRWMVIWGCYVRKRRQGPDLLCGLLELGMARCRDGAGAAGACRPRAHGAQACEACKVRSERAVRSPGAYKRTPRFAQEVEHGDWA